VVVVVVMVAPTVLGGGGGRARAGGRGAEVGAEVREAVGEGEENGLGDGDEGKKTAQRRSPSDSELPDRCPRGKQARNHET